MDASIIHDMIDFGKTHSPMLSKGMCSHHIATISSGKEIIVKNCYNYITGRCLNCHAEQHALLSYLRQTPTLRHLADIINFSSLATDKMMSYFKKYYLPSSKTT